jgi:hypothetical protein
MDEEAELPGMNLLLQIPVRAIVSDTRSRKLRHADAAFDSAHYRKT